MPRAVEEGGGGGPDAPTPAVVAERPSGVPTWSEALSDPEIWAALAVRVTLELDRLGAAVRLGALERLSLGSAAGSTLLATDASQVHLVRAGAGAHEVPELEQRLEAWRRARVSASPTTPAAPAPRGLRPRTSTAPPRLEGARDTSPLAPGDSAFTGDLAQFSVAELLQFLRAAQRSGILHCHVPIGTGVLVLQRGSIIQASLTGVSVPTSTPVGAAGATAWTLLEEEILAVLLELVRWKLGQFAFEPARASPTSEGPGVADVQALLLEVFRRLDEETAGPDAASPPGARGGVDPESGHG